MARNYRRREPSRQPKPLTLVVTEGELTEPSYLRAFKRIHGAKRATLKIIPLGQDPRAVVEKAMRERSDSSPGAAPATSSKKPSAERPVTTVAAPSAIALKKGRYVFTRSDLRTRARSTRREDAPDHPWQISKPFRLLRASSLFLAVVLNGQDKSLRHGTDQVQAFRLGWPGPSGTRRPTCQGRTGKVRM